MTGFGESHQREAEIAVSVEVRTINNRYFKLTVKCADGYGVLDRSSRHPRRTSRHARRLLDR
jgi:uncharacterized protein YicC (UPF0701 family)